MAEFAEIVPDERYATASSSTKIDKHAAADLEKVTDYYEEREDVVMDAAKMAAATGKHLTPTAPPVQTMKVREVDVLLVADQMDIPKVAAERALRAHSGDVKRTLIALTTGEYSSIIRV